MHDEPLFEVRNLVKAFGSAPPAVDVDELVVAGGEVFGLLGSNGAGKTTCVKMMVGLMQPTSGRVTFRGQDLRAAAEECRRSVAYMPQSGFALNSLRGHEALLLGGQFRGLRRAERRNEADRVQELLGISHLANKVVSGMSGGERRLLQIAVSLVGNLPIVVLDEPTNDLDPEARSRVWRVIGELRDSGTSVILVTHNHVEAERVLDRVAVFRSGRVVSTGTPLEVKESIADRIRIEFRSSRRVDLTATPYARAEEPHGHLSVVSVPRDSLSRAVDELGLASMDQFRVQSPTLEDVFRVQNS